MTQPGLSASGGQPKRVGTTNEPNDFLRLPEKLAGRDWLTCGFLKRLIRNLVTNERKKAGSRKTYTASFQLNRDDERETGRAEPEDSPGPQNLMPFDLRESIQWALNKLPERERQVVKSMFLEQKASIEVAEQLDCTPQAVTRLLRMARERLRRLLCEWRE